MRMIRQSRWAAGYAVPALALLAIMLLHPTSARAQWTTGNPTTTTSTVGIGTPAPLYKLDVRSAQAKTDDTQHVIFTAGSSESETPFLFTMQWWGANMLNERRVELQTSERNVGDGGNLVLQPRGGWVGIGTSSPKSALHVHSDAAAQMIRVSGAGGGIVNFQDKSAAAQRQMYQWRSQGGVFRMALLDEDDETLVRDNILAADYAGNVGIGTASPGALLDVSGGAGTGTLNVSGGGGTGGGVGQLSFNRVGTGELGRVEVQRSGFNDQGYMAFYTKATGAAAAERMRIDAAGGVGIGIAPAAGYKLDVAGGVRVLHPSGSTSGGDLTVAGTITGGTIEAKYQDVAEWVPSTQKLAAGTVVVLDTGKNNHVVASAAAYDTKVAGVVSAEPGVILGVPGDDKVKVATTGRVKVKVDATRGAIKVGDLLVTSGVEGVAMKSVPVDLGGTQIHRPGTIIGKALEPLEKGVGEILVLLSLQ